MQHILVINPVRKLMIRISLSQFCCGTRTIMRGAFRKIGTRLAEPAMIIMMIIIGIKCEMLHMI